jgi:sulfide dehydrogenase [flavocytochrome c] flavoprotein subunit
MTRGCVNLRRRALLQAALGGAFCPRRSSSATPRSRVIVVGAGFGGATCAKYLRLLTPDTAVLLIDQRPQFLTGPFSNLVIAGLTTPANITRRTAAIGRAHGVDSRIDRVTDIDPVRLVVSTAAGKSYRADRIVVSPGIAMRWEAIEGLDENRSASMPHAWMGGGQVLALRRRLAQVADGGTILIGSPPNPYRCPPGPYERASLMAYALMQSGRTRTKIIVADAKDDFSKSALFKLEWDRLYPQMIDWIARGTGGEVVRVDVASGRVWLRGSGAPIATQLASIIPAQRAGLLAERADLIDESGWCPVNPVDFESTKHAGVHVIGDAALGAPMPKSAFAANSQAKLCAAAIAADLRGAPAPEARLLNTCYSMLSDRAAISVSGYYGAVDGRLSTLSEGISPLSGDADLRAREARQARAWYASVTADSFGRP